MFKIYIYMINIITVTAYSILAKLVSDKSRTKELNELGYVKPDRLLSFVVFLSIFLVAALRWRVGTDFWQYEKNFIEAIDYTIVDVIAKAPEYFASLIPMITGKIFRDPQVAFIVYAFITYYLIEKGIRNYSYNYPLSVILYIMTMSYYRSFNATRQWCAAAILFYGYEFILRKDFKKYLIIVIIATMFHSASLVAIPFYFIVNNRFFSKRNLIISICFILFAILFENIIFDFMKLLQNTDYGYYSEWFKVSGRDAHPMRFVVSIIPLIIFILFYRKYKMLEQGRKDIDIIMNFTLLNSLFMLLSIKNYIFSRFCAFTELYIILLIPEIIRLFPKGKKRLLVYFIIIICYFAYMYLLIPRESRLLPYTTIFSRPQIIY